MIKGFIKEVQNADLWRADNGCRNGGSLRFFIFADVDGAVDVFFGSKDR